MEMEYSYQNNIRMGDPNRNKFAKTSFILSLISIILSPISIIQILGIVFGILGLKSEKKGLSIAGLVISIITMVIGIVIIISLVSLSTFGGVLSNARERADEQMAINIQNAIVQYIDETGDIDLEFGTNNTIEVNTLLTKLQSKININGNTYGPYLILDDNNRDEVKLHSPKNKGWEIIIDKTQGTLKVSPSETGDSIDIKN